MQEFLPTVLFSLSLPSINGRLTDVAKRLTEFENYRTQDQYDLAQTQKIFVMHFVTSFLPTILTAFVYVPFGAKIMPWLEIGRASLVELLLLSARQTQPPRLRSKVDPNRLQQEVIYLTVTAQVLNFGEEVVLPYMKRYLHNKWREYRAQSTSTSTSTSTTFSSRKDPAGGRARQHSVVTHALLVDHPDETSFLRRVRAEAESEPYNVQEDILEMCVQFGYLALFGVAWPLGPLGFLLNNWLELRGDFFKLSIECQRPPPIRADSIGPSLQGLEFLSWLGTLSTAAIVHLYRPRRQAEPADLDVDHSRLSTVLLTVFFAEQVYLGVKVAVRACLQKVAFFDSARLEDARRYALRKTFFETARKSAHRPPPPPFPTPPTPPPLPSLHPRPRAADRPTAATDGDTPFWTRSPSTLPADAAARLINALSSAKHKGGKAE